MSRTAAGDVGAFTELYDRYARRLHAWCAHVLGVGRAEDAMQEIFLRVWQHAGQFDPERGKFTTWFTAIARHYLLHMLRRESIRRRVAIATEARPSSNKRGRWLPVQRSRWLSVRMAPPWRGRSGSSLTSSARCWYWRTLEA